MCWWLWCAGLSVCRPVLGQYLGVLMSVMCWAVSLQTCIGSVPWCVDECDVLGCQFADLYWVSTLVCWWVWCAGLSVCRPVLGQYLGVLMTVMCWAVVAGIVSVPVQLKIPGTCNETAFCRAMQAKVTEQTEQQVNNNNRGHLYCALCLSKLFTA